MSTELNLRFPDAQHVIVRLGTGDDGSRRLDFTNPIFDRDLRDIRWYVETYGAHSLGDPDDREAHRIAAQLPVWGKALFRAVFTDHEARRRLDDLQKAKDDTRLLTISAEDPAILGLPWELLHDPARGGVFLFMKTPRISIRRRVAGEPGEGEIYRPAAKQTLHLLFVVSRPEKTGFLDPRADAQPVLDAIDEHAPGRVTHEFLRPPTLDALVERLEDRSKPPVDILHFDGHGVFDRYGNLPNRVAAAQIDRIERLEEMLRLTKVDVPVDPNCPPNTGYLLFEKPDGACDPVSAERLGANLQRHEVALVILSACQSAAVGKDQEKEDGQENGPMGSVAARLTATGIPSVLAMTHSVLVHTTRALFGVFYKELSRHKGIGEALDNARRFLANHPEKYDVQRGPDRVPLKLYDWFLPALYQQGSDSALLTEDEDGKQKQVAPPQLRTNLRKPPEGGFFGRRRDLWHIERWFADKTRRITITGFGGQGKTALALEAGRWLTRVGLFEAAVFVDHSRVQAADAVAVAKNEIAKVFDRTLIDAAAVTDVLGQTPTLVILDNLEALALESLRALLDAAVSWSEAGGSRVLCTTRRPDFGHAAYRIEGTHKHRRIQLDGLGSKQAHDDALEWYANLTKLPPEPEMPPPEREALINLFDRVKFHPLSIRVLTQQLKTRRIADVGERLEQLLAQPPRTPGGTPGEVAGEDTPAELLASLELSLDKLDDTARRVLPRLGVFQGGAMEPDLMIITGLGDPHESQRAQLQERLAAAEDGRVRLEDDKEVPAEVLDGIKAKLREQLAELPPPPIANVWSGLRRQLEAVGLIEAESIPGLAVPFIRFHPTLAPMLWARLDAAERERLSTAHRQRYRTLSLYLYREDARNPRQARAIAWREQPNLLHAVCAAFDAGEPDAVDFASSVNKFLGFFGLKQEMESLTVRAQEAAGEAGSHERFLAQTSRGEQLFDARQLIEAARVFRAILQQLGEAPTFNRASTLGWLGRCFRAGGRPDLAERSHRDAIAVWGNLKQTDQVKRERGIDLTDLADALMDHGKYAEARQAYQDGLKVADELKDLRQQGVTLGQLGSLAIREGNLEEAERRLRTALTLFQQLREPASESVAWHQLGRVFEEARQWDEAERHYRESARIKEDHDDLAAAARTWTQLANVCVLSGKQDAAERWYRKAIEGFRVGSETLSLSKALSNLANLLRTQPGRLAEARQLAEEAMTIDQTLDPGAAEIWNTYHLLAMIEEKETQAATDDRRKAELQAQAREHLRLARDARRNFAGTRHRLKQHLPVILGTIVAVHEPAHRQRLEQALSDLEERGWTNLVAAVRRILAGERDADTLCADLDSEDSMIIETILAGLADPSTLSDLLPSESEGSTSGD